MKSLLIDWRHCDSKKVYCGQFISLLWPIVTIKCWCCRRKQSNKVRDNQLSILSTKQLKVISVFIWLSYGKERLFAIDLLFIFIFSFCSSFHETIQSPEAPRWPAKNKYPCKTSNPCHVMKCHMSVNPNNGRDYIYKLFTFPCIVSMSFHFFLVSTPSLDSCL